MLLVLLTWWLDIDKTANYQVVELFSGVGRIAAFAKFVGYKSVAVDIKYGQEYAQKTGKRSPMDMNSNAGLMFPNCTIGCSCKRKLISQFFRHFLIFTCKLRLCLHILLSSEWGAVCSFLAIVCSSWVPVTRGSTLRSFMTPLGFEDYPGVRKSNKMTSRTLKGFVLHQAEVNRTQNNNRYCKYLHCLLHLYAMFDLTQANASKLCEPQR